MEDGSINALTLGSASNFTGFKVRARTKFMNRQDNRYQLSLVYWGTMISSLGTFTFPGATIGVLTQQNFAYWQIGGLMALTRVGSLVGSFFFGDVSDRHDAKKTVILTEVLAFALSILLIASWASGRQGFGWFAGFVFLRFVVISIGGPGKNKIVKSLSDQYKKSHFRTAITLNTVTYGPGVVGSILGFFAVKYLNYYWVLGFDAITFVITGILLLSLNSAPKPSDAADLGFAHKLNVYFRHRRLAWFDVLLAIPFMGTNVLMSRLSGGVGYRAPLLLATFGLGAIISAELFRWGHSRRSHGFAYLLLLCSFVSMFLFRSNFSTIMLAVTLRNICYWYLFNLYTGLFQTREDGKNIAALFSARAFVVTCLLGLGEIFVGMLGDHYSLAFDLGFRAAVTFIIFLLALRTNYVEAT